MWAVWLVFIVWAAGFAWSCIIESVLLAALTFFGGILFFGLACWYSDRDPVFVKDFKLWRRAHKGEVIVLSASTYLSLHAANATKYPLRRRRDWYGGDVCMYSWEQRKLLKAIEKSERLVEIKKHSVHTEKLLDVCEEMRKDLYSLQDQAIQEQADALKTMKEVQGRLQGGA